MAVESRRKSKRLFDAIRKRLSAHAKRRGANKKTPFFPETAEPPKNPLREAWRAEALQIQSEPGDMRGGFGSLAQQGFRVSTNGTHFCGDAGRGGKPLPMPSAAAACTPPGAAASRFRYHVPAVRFAHRNMMFPSLQGCSQPCAARFPCAFPRPRLQAQGKRVLAEKAGSAGLFRQAGRSSRKRRGRRKAGHAGRARARRFGPACGPTRPGFPANSYRSLSPFAPVCRKAARSGEARRLPPRLDRPRQPCYLCVQHSGNAEAKRRCGCG